MRVWVSVRSLWVSLWVILPCCAFAPGCTRRRRGGEGVHPGGRSVYHKAQMHTTTAKDADQAASVCTWKCSVRYFVRRQLVAV